jgi:NADPH-dependent curcumin reductase CurA
MKGDFLFIETIVHGFDQLPTAFLELFYGGNTSAEIIEA